jgi:DNA-directed RNA polymerase subunit E'
MDEDVEFIQERRGFKGKETGRLIEAGDIVNVRITQISKASKRSGLFRIGLTMRQPYLGKKEWYKETKQVEDKEQK